METEAHKGETSCYGHQAEVGMEDSCSTTESTSLNSGPWPRRSCTIGQSALLPQAPSPPLPQPPRPLHCSSHPGHAPLQGLCSGRWPPTNSLLTDLHIAPSLPLCLHPSLRMNVPAPVLTPSVPSRLYSSPLHSPHNSVCVGDSLVSAPTRMSAPPGEQGLTSVELPTVPQCLQRGEAGS